MEDLLIKSYNTAQSTTIPVDAINSIISGGNAENAENEQIEEEAGSTTQPVNGEDADEEPTYNVGDYVRCTYSDGIDYEAKIIKINYNRKTCRIRYIGYENEQTVNWNALIASWGEEARNAQYEIGKAAAESTESEISSKKANNTPKGFNPPPVPPIPPMLFDSDDEEKNQQFAQLLISWFMTGYYTGLHQRNMQSSKK